MSAVAHIDEYKTGRFYGEEFRGSASWNGYENNVLLRSEGLEDGQLRFTEVAMATGTDDRLDTRGVAIADFDRDGDLDIALSHNPGDGAKHQARAVLYRNDLADGLASIRFELRGTVSNREGLGAVVSVRVDDRWLSRLRAAGSGYASQHSARLHFGLRDVEQIDAVEVTWPSGKVDRHGALATNATYLWVEGSVPRLLPAVKPARLGPRETAP